jgi:tetratricopeptide (TPR) repeat protein
MTFSIVQLGFPNGSIEIIKRGEFLSKEIGDYKSQKFFKMPIGTYYTYKGEHQTLSEFQTDKKYSKVIDEKNIELIVDKAIVQCLSWHGLGEYYKIKDFVPELLNLIDNSKRSKEFIQDDNVRSSYLILTAYSGIAFGNLGYFDEGETLINKSIESANQTNKSSDMELAEFFAGDFYHAKGDWIQDIKHFKKSIEFCEETKNLLILSVANSFLGYLYSFTNKAKKGKHHGEIALKIQEKSGIEGYSSFVYWALGSIFIDLGDFEMANINIREALKRSQKNNEKYIEGLSWLAFGKFLTKIQKFSSETEKTYCKSIELFQKLKLAPFYAQSYLFLGEFFLNIEERKKAKENLYVAKKLFERMEMDFWLKKAQHLLLAV